jgi:hypothetical protein
MEQPSELSSQEESKLLSQYAGEPIIRALLAVDFFIRRAAHRLLAALSLRSTEAR